MKAGPRRMLAADGGSGGGRPATNSVDVSANGPLHLQGNVRVTGKDGTLISDESEVWLCRCGASKNKPFCDGSHSKIDFVDEGVLAEGGAGSPASVSSAQALTITVMPAGPLLIKGPVELRDAAGTVARRCEKGALCRCGASETKPFCDGTHSKIDFQGD
ncbi:MAG: CDGSH iron-sulfur domain-containing protein [Acidobacteriota bacterium]|nr:CDGSH iron-sulfur domain-containing protein [Acidobacteriota bacterium]